MQNQELITRKHYKRIFEPVIDTFCSDCQSRLHTNPMRILDCKVDRDKEAVKMHLKLRNT